MSEMIVIDGAAGEGGGQILRTSLALSLVTRRPFRIERIRAGRNKPGLLRQHLTGVNAAAAMSGARASGAELGSQALSFAPGQLRGGEYRLAVGTAGSTTLVLQAVLPALLCADDSTRLILEGGTHNPSAPPFDFLATTFLPLLRRMGAKVAARLDAPGFYPAGGGRIVVDVEPCGSLRPLHLLERGAVKVHARALLASLPESIGKRELSVVRERMGLDRSMARIEQVGGSIGPGNAVVIVIESDSVTEVITSFGAKGVSAEAVATEACDEAWRYLRAEIPVGIHLADQLLLPMALAGCGTFRTLTPTEHTKTNAAVIQRFLDLPIAFTSLSSDVTEVRVGQSTGESS
jgi:RNA 3'-terminal phosphate cyclase (ATP)